MAEGKQRRATLAPVPGQPAQSATVEPSPAAAVKGKRPRSGSDLFARIDPDLKKEVDVVAAMLQVKLNVLVGAVLQEHVSRDRLDELTKLVERYKPPGG